MTTTTRTSATSKLTLPSPIELRIERVFDANRDKVFRAWTDPELVRRWMGAPEYPMVRSTMDLRPGGMYQWVWQAGPGEQVADGRILDVLAPSRLVTAETMRPSPWGETLNLIVFTEQDGKTTVAVHTTFPDAGSRDLALSCGAQNGWDQGFARLDTLVKGIG